MLFWRFRNVLCWFTKPFLWHLNDVRMLIFIINLWSHYPNFLKRKLKPKSQTWQMPQRWRVAEVSPQRPSAEPVLWAPCRRCLLGRGELLTDRLLGLGTVYPLHYGYLNSKTELIFHEVFPMKWKIDVSHWAGYLPSSLNCSLILFNCKLKRSKIFENVDVDLAILELLLWLHFILITSFSLFLN